VERRAREELEATLAARRELGPEHEAELVAGFLERIDREIDRRVEERVRALAPRRPRGSALHPANLALCIPIVAIAGGIGGVPGLLIAFLALVLVFGLAESRR
jgi:hypothetical protein